MAYGIGLVFDADTEAHIRQLWCQLARQGLTTPLARPGCLPHVSLILSEQLCVAELARDLEAFEPCCERLELRLSYVGVFTEPEIVLFYGLTPTAGLLRLHADVDQIYDRWGAPIMPRSQADLWVPHCTLAVRLEMDQCSAAIAVASERPLPWVVPRARLAIVRFDPSCVELLKVFPWLT